MKSLKKQAGLTLVEIAIVIGLIGILTFSVIGSVSTLMTAKSTYETEARLERARNAFSSAYRANASVVDDVSGREFRLSPTVSIANDTGADVAATNTALNAIAGYGQLSPIEITEDSFAGRYKIYVSNRIASPMAGGYTVYHHKIAIVSMGPNAKIDVGTTMDAATGALTLALDDIGVVVDGFQIQRQLIEESVARVDRIAKAYEKYFTNRYLANPGRDISINYFANNGTTPARWDSTGLATNSGGTWADASTLNFTQALGLSAADLRSSYGANIQADNSSALVRHPDNATAAMAIAPYSAQVRVALPGGQTYTQSAIGSF